MPQPVFFTSATTGWFLLGIPWTVLTLLGTLVGTLGICLVYGWIGVAGLMFGCPFVMFGFAMLVTPVWAYCKAMKTVYVITDHRAITFEGEGRGLLTIRSYPPEKLTTISCKEKKDGSGNVVITHRAWSDSKDQGELEGLGFFRIADAKSVAHRLRKLAKQAKKPKQTSDS